MPTPADYRRVLKAQLEQLKVKRSFYQRQKYDDGDFDYVRVDTYDVADEKLVKGVFETIQLLIKISKEARDEEIARELKAEVLAVLSSLGSAQDLAKGASRGSITAYLKTIELFELADQIILLKELGIALVEARNSGVVDYISYIRTLKTTGKLSSNEVLDLFNQQGQFSPFLTEFFSVAVVQQYMELLSMLGEGLEDEALNQFQALRIKLLQQAKPDGQSFWGCLSAYKKFDHCELRTDCLGFLEEYLDTGQNPKPVIALLAEVLKRSENYALFEAIAYTEVTPVRSAAIDSSLRLLERLTKLETKLSLGSPLAAVGRVIASRGSLSQLNAYFILLDKLCAEGVFDVDECMEMLLAYPLATLGVIAALRCSTDHVNAVLGYVKSLALRGVAKQKVTQFFMQAGRYSQVGPMESFTRRLIATSFSEHRDQTSYLNLAELIRLDYFDNELLKEFVVFKDLIITATVDAALVGLTETDEKDLARFNFALKAHDPDTAFGRYLLLATHGDGDAKASKKVLSEQLATILKDNITKVHEHLVSGALTDNQRKGLAFLKEAVAAHMKTLPEPQRLNAHIDALVRENALGQFFYESRDKTRVGAALGFNATNATKGVLKIVFDELKTYPRAVLFNFLKDECRMDQFEALRFFEGDLVAHLAQTLDDEQFWDHYTRVMDISHPNEFFRYYFVLNGQKPFSSASPIMRNINLILASKVSLLVSKIETDDIKRETFSAGSLKEIQDSFLKAIQALPNHEYKALLAKALKPDQKLHAFLSDRTAEIRKLLDRSNVVVGSTAGIAAAAAGAGAGSLRSGLFSAGGKAAAPADTMSASAASSYDKRL